MRLNMHAIQDTNGTLEIHCSQPSAWRRHTMMMMMNTEMKSTEKVPVFLVPEDCTQKIRSELEKLKLWNATYSLMKVAGTGQVAIPIDVNRSNITEITHRWPDFKIDQLHLPFSKKIKSKQNSPANILQNEMRCLLAAYGLEKNLLHEVPTKWERHEDLVIIPASAFSSLEWKLIGKSLWETVAKSLSCKRLARHAAVAADGFRSSQVVMLLGEDGVVTHVDNGIRYRYDVTKCMFSSGNITEKLRVAGLDCRNETVVDLYAGIGYFTLPFLIHGKAQHVHACEWNPNAILALKHNLQLNDVSEKCTMHEGDSRLLQLSPVADRVNLGLIPSSEEGWPIAVQVLRQEGGILHIHGCVTTFPRRNLSSKANNDQRSEQKSEPIAKGDTENFGEICTEKNSDTHNYGKISTQNNSEAQNYREMCSLNSDSLEFGEISSHMNYSEAGYILDDITTQKDPHSLSIISYPGKCFCKDGKHEDENHHHCKDSMTSCLTASDNHDVQLQSNQTSEHMTAKSHDLLSTSRESSEKETTLLACEEWAILVQGKIRSLLSAKKGGVWSVKVLHTEIVKSYAPHIVHVVLDLECRPKDIN